MSLADLTDAQRKELKVEGGVFVDNAQGVATRAGLRRGDVILAVNNQDVKSVEQFRQLMGSFEKGRIVDDKELKDTYANARPYKSWIDSVRVRLDDVATRPGGIDALMGEALRAARDRGAQLGR